MGPEVDPEPLDRGLAATHDRADDVILVGDPELPVQRAEPLERVLVPVLDGRRDADAEPALAKATDRIDDVAEVPLPAQGVVRLGLGRVERELEAPTSSPASGASRSSSFWPKSVPFVSATVGRSEATSASASGNRAA